MQELYTKIKRFLFKYKLDISIGTGALVLGLLLGWQLEREYRILTIMLENFYD